MNAISRGLDGSETSRIIEPWVPLWHFEPLPSVVSAAILPSGRSWTSYCEPPPQSKTPTRFGLRGSEMSAMTSPSV